MSPVPFSISLFLKEFPDQLATTRKKIPDGPPKESDVKILSPLARLYEWPFFANLLSLTFMAIVLYFALTLHKLGGFDVETDFYGGYAPEAKAFLSGTIVIDAYHGPLYPLVLGLTSLVVGDLFRTGIMIAIFSAAMVVYTVFEMTKSISSADIAFLTTVFTAVNLTFVFYSYSAGTDMFFVMLALAGIFLLFRKPEVTIPELCGSSVLLGCAYLVRYNGIVFLVSIPLVLAFGGLQVKGKNKFTATAIWGIVFLATIAPWSIYLKIHKGSFFYNTDYQNLAFELFGGGLANWDQFWFKAANKYTSYWDVLSADPLLVVKTLLVNTYEHFANDISSLNNLFVGIPSAVGVALFAFSRPPKRAVGLAAIYVSFFAVLLTMFYTERFSLFLLPFYSFFAAYAVKRVLAAVRKDKPLVVIVNLAVGAIIVLTFLASWSYNSVMIANKGADDMIYLTEWYHNKFHDQFSDAKLAARKPHMPYLLNMKWYPFPLIDNYDTLLAVFRRDSVRFLYYGYFEGSNRPQFKNLLEDVPHPGLKMLSIVKHQNSVRSVLYEVEK